MFAFSSEPIDIERLRDQVSDVRAGAVAVFEGRVRNHNDGHQVLALEYEAFESLGAKEGENILKEASDRFSLLGAYCVHRTGKLEIGDVAVWVAAVAAHRGAAFDACRYIIDEIKHRLPVWKKEHYVEGPAIWVNCQSCAAAHSPQTAAQPAQSICAPIGSRQMSGVSRLDFSAAPPVMTDFSVPESRQCFEELDQRGSAGSITVGEAEFYCRQTILKEIGQDGQRKLKQSSVLVIGAGGLGSSALMYLGAAGVGTIGICEPDNLEVSNLHRQVLYETADLAKSKADLAGRRIRQNNPFVQVRVHRQALSPENSLEIMKGYDLIIDCTDNFDAKFLIADSAYLSQIPLIQSSVYQYEGQIQMSTPSGLGQCLRCLWTEMPEAGCVGSCAESGILGSVVGVFGSLQATEAVKHIVGLPSALSEYVVLFDLLNYNLKRVKRVKNPDCVLCGVNRSIERIDPCFYSPEPTLLAADWEVDILSLSQKDLAEYQMIDIREPGEDKALLLKRLLRVPLIELPLSKFDTNNPPLEPGHKYLIVCQRGVRSGKLVASLRGRGFRNVFSVLGGMEAIRRKFIA